MGVTVVFPINLPDGKNSQQLIDSLQKKLEFLGAQKVGSWSLDCEAFQSVQSSEGALKVIYLMHSSEHPQLTFSITEAGQCVVVQNGFDLLMAKLKAFYIPRKGGKTDIKGTKFDYGDFQMKIATVTQASTFKKIVVEVHYTPCYEMNECWELIGEFVSTVIDKSIAMPPMPASIVDKKLDRFTVPDTMLQYLQLISGTKKN